MMKCKTAIWIIGIIILFSVQGYAAEEKIIFTSYDASAQGAIITVSGKTEPKKVRVLHTAYLEALSGGCDFSNCEDSVTTGLCPGYFVIKLYVAIATCESGTSSNYGANFRGYTHYPISTVVQFYLRENPAVGEYSDYSSYKLVATEFPSNLTDESVKISNNGKTTFEGVGADIFTAHNISLLGYDGLYWGTFQWNPYTLSWTLKDAGVEK